MNRFAATYASSLPGDPAAPPAPPATQGQFQNAPDVRRYILAGDATVTLRSRASGMHHTYRVTRADPTETDRNPPWFVSVLANSDQFLYLGLLRETAGRVAFRLTKKSSHPESAATVKAFTWAWAHVDAGRVPAQLEIRHEGRCGRCNRPLTHPESLDLGIGPECAQKMGLR
jgi:hypothetical protein